MRKYYVERDGEAPVEPSRKIDDFNLLRVAIEDIESHMALARQATQKAAYEEALYALAMCANAARQVDEAGFKNRELVLPKLYLTLNAEVLENLREFVQVKPDWNVPGAFRAIQLPLEYEPTYSPGARPFEMCLVFIDEHLKSMPDDFLKGDDIKQENLLAMIPASSPGQMVLGSPSVVGALVPAGDMTFAPEPQLDEEDESEEGRFKRRRMKTFFSPEEEDQLIHGVVKFGIGEWSTIVRNYRFNDRTSKDLCDKWRNMNNKNNKESTMRRVAAAERDAMRERQGKSSGDIDMTDTSALLRLEDKPLPPRARTPGERRPRKKRDDGTDGVPRRRGGRPKAVSQQPLSATLVSHEASALASVASEVSAQAMALLDPNAGPPSVDAVLLDLHQMDVPVHHHHHHHHSDHEHHHVDDHVDHELGHHPLDVSPSAVLSAPVDLTVPPSLPMTRGGRYLAKRSSKFTEGPLDHGVHSNGTDLAPSLPDPAATLSATLSDPHSVLLPAAPDFKA
eukprot:TRINITY_DN7320_c0_g1_i1.p1 TRINITY_DN7320_c0_g1~~TRINITY_DN7320_c0_g1_i1.p1  ORF type:complete len:574 (-),score=177.38 TRINITY_DN7320_c0_g1_i1:331-1857(-)